MFSVKRLARNPREREISKIGRQLSVRAQNLALAFIKEMEHVQT
jgi:hypothetical protein